MSNDTTPKMTAETSEALRAEFPARSIGKLPKGNTTVDYVGHAAVTDRLLSVDPEWNWEPVAYGDDGLPFVARNGDFWIRLTVRGVTRLGVGDGPTAKIRAGDAIRNAAMRFGVALALWTRDELEFLGTMPHPGDTDGTVTSMSANDRLRALAGAPDGVDGGSGEILTDAAYTAAGGQA